MNLKTSAEITIMAEGGRRLAQVLETLRQAVHPGIPTLELDRLAYDLITKGGDEPAFLGYIPGGTDKPYPATLCASVNDTVVHGLPSNYILKDGDLLKLDLGLIHKKFYLDSAITVGVGKISKEAQNLMEVTERAMYAGIEAAKAGSTLGDIGAAVQAIIEENGFGVVRTLTGHGIGRELHEDPNVYNYGKRGSGEKLMPGLVIAIEPMVTMGGRDVRQAKDDSFVTKDGSLAAHFEHTVAITEQGTKILTKI